MRGVEYNVNQNGLPHIWQRKNDRCRQKLVPLLVKERIIFAKNYSTITGHQGEGRMYKTLGQNFLWPLLKNDVYQKNTL